MADSEEKSYTYKYYLLSLFQAVMVDLQSYKDIDSYFSKNL